MKAEVEALVEELNRLRKAGVERVNVSEGALMALRACTVEREIGDVARAKVLDAIPENVRSADVAVFDKVMVDTEEVKRVSSRSNGPKLPKPPLVALSGDSKAAQWDALRKQMEACPVCKERLQPGAQLVLGEGNLDADILFVGDSPSALEEKTGEPFQGPDGELLGKMMGAAGLKREEVFVTTLVPWRPGAASSKTKRPASAQELAFCLPYFEALVKLVQPKVIVALGGAVLTVLIGAEKRLNMRDEHGRWQELGKVAVLPTFDPAYLILNNTKQDKRAAWLDWLAMMEKVGLPISEKQRGYFA